MERKFNIDGVCYPDEHYMVDLTERIREIKTLIDDKKYFVINRARQYGKTTTIRMLTRYLSTEYVVFSISFEGIGNVVYEDEYTFCKRVCGLLYDTMYYGEVQDIPDIIKETCCKLGSADGPKTDFRDLSNFISKMCIEIGKPIILIIDEVDQACNQEIFLGFLGMLRDKYLNRKNRPTFQSVILVGVYDIKNLKLKIRKGNEHQYNSPWNIAAKFSVDMSFSKEDIVGMLEEYEKDHKTEMNVDQMAQLIFDFTSGYPFLVSYLCKITAEMNAGSSAVLKYNDWTRDGIINAVKILLKEPNTLFDDMIKHLAEFPELTTMLKNILFNGWTYPYNIYNQAVSVGTMFGFITERDGSVSVSNRIFETHMYNYFLSEELSCSQDVRLTPPDRNQFIINGYLDMDLVMQKFMMHYKDIYHDSDDKFLEENARRLFLLYLKPIINGVGNYYIEARTRNNQRTDVIVDYRGRQYIIEMKIYHGNEYNKKGERQLAVYLDSYHQERGYLLCFNFNKNRISGIKEIECDGKKIMEIVV